MARSPANNRTDLVTLTVRVPKKVKTILQKYADEDLRTVGNWLSMHILSIEQHKRKTTVVETTTTDSETTTTDTPWDANW